MLYRELANGILASLDDMLDIHGSVSFTYLNTGDQQFLFPQDYLEECQEFEPALAAPLLKELSSLELGKLYKVTFIQGNGYHVCEEPDLTLEKRLHNVIKLIENGYGQSFKLDIFEYNIDLTKFDALAFAVFNLIEYTRLYVVEFGYDSTVRVNLELDNLATLTMESSQGHVITSEVTPQSVTLLEAFCK